MQPVSDKARSGATNFIVVQLPEPTSRSDYPTIADITKERVRRVIKKLDAEDEGKLDIDGRGKQDRGFRVFKLAESTSRPGTAARRRMPTLWPSSSNCTSTTSARGARTRTCSMSCC